MKRQVNQLKNSNVYKRITITLSDPKQGYIEGRDSGNQPVKLSFSFFYSPYVQVPKIGEDWVVKKIDNNWVLQSRYEDSSQTKEISDLKPGDVRVESKNILHINADEEIMMDFNKAAPSLRRLGGETLPGSALYGSGTLDRIQAGTVITTWGTALPGTAVDGQEEKVIFTAQDGRNIGWTFKYNQTAPTQHKWQFIGGAPYINFVNGSVSTTGTSWFNGDTNASGTSPFNYGGTPVLTIQYDGEYVLSGGAECIASANNMGFNLGLSINGTIPSSTLSAYASVKDTPISVNTTYRIDLKTGDVLTEVYRKDPANLGGGGTATFFNRWLQIIPLRVQA